MLLPAPLEGTLRRAILDECNTDVNIFTYSKTVNQMVTVRTGFALFLYQMELAKRVLSIASELGEIQVVEVLD